MKNRTVAQRLYLSLGSLFCLFALGLGVKAWFERHDSLNQQAIVDRQREVSVAAAQMRGDLLQMSEPRLR